jgi:malonate transporter and related proteins
VISILNALGPVFLVVIAGVLLNRYRFPGDAFWPLAERLTYFILFPALLIHKLALASFDGGAGMGILSSLSLQLLAVTTILFLLSNRISANGADFTSIFQGSIRFNTYVGLAVAEQLFGEMGAVLAALTVGVMIPVTNIFCVTIFAIKTGEGSVTVGGIVREIGKNPLILSCLVGIFLNVSEIGLPFWSEPVLSILSQPALPLGLLAVGAGLNLSTLGSSLSSLALSSAIKLLIMPILAAFISSWVGLEGLSRQILILIFALPTAPSAFILARQLGGNASLMAALITGQTLLAMVTMPLIIWWLVL